jgi:hypothetical protein
MNLAARTELNRNRHEGVQPTWRPTVRYSGSLPSEFQRGSDALAATASPFRALPKRKTAAYTPACRRVVPGDGAPGSNGRDVL